MSDIVARRTFGADDQGRFADLSGDRNPMHLDPVAARRTQAGQPVVHGIHALLWALEEVRLAHPDLPPPRAIRADFLSFLPVGRAATLRALEVGGRFAVESEGVPILRAQLRPAPYASPKGPPPSDTVGVAPDVPAALDLTEIAGRGGAVAFASGEDAASAAFPATAAWLGAARVAALLACTRLVGMVCPGLHSIFNRLDLDLVAAEHGRDQLDFAVVAIDPRFRRVRLSVAGGGIAGTLATSARRPPVTQPSISEIGHRVEPDAFSGAKVLVVGGSRGLGEITAKLLAAGGATTLITYAQGRDDASRVVDEIAGWGGSCHAIRYDATFDPRAQFAADDLAGLTHCYYFATPPIFGPVAGAYDKARFDRFASLYVDGFAALCSVLADGDGIGIYYPSSVALRERPAGMGEYAMAKAAGEILCAEIARDCPDLRILTTRLPRLATDQTATLIATDDAPAIDILLPIVRRVQGIAEA